MARVISFSIPESESYILQQLEQLKSEYGNLSNFFVRLLKSYFEGNFELNNFNKELIKVRELYKELLEYRKKFEEWESRLLELEQLLKEKQEAQQLEEQLPLLRKLKDVVFEDINELMNSRVVQPEHAIKARLTTFATEHKISYPEAVSLFFKAFPDLKERLEGRL
ncbi:hypothetical protein [Geoglobus ahangari]